MKKPLFFLIVFISFNIFSQDFNLKGNIKNILGENIENVDITNLTSEVNFVSDNQGNFRIPVKIGDTLTFSHIAYDSATYFVNKSNIANIVLGNRNAQLSEVIIKTKKVKRKATYKVGLSRIDVKSSNYFYGDQIMPNYFSIGQMLRGRVPGLSIRPSENGFSFNSFLRNSDTPVLWDFNGIIMQEEPQVVSNEIMSIAILRSPAETVVYGPRGSGGVIVVRTYPDEYMKELLDGESINNPITNDNFYLGDATPYKYVKKDFKYVNSYLDSLNKNNSFEKYIEAETRYKANRDFYEQTLLFLKENYLSKNLIYRVLKDYQESSDVDIKKQRFIAFYYGVLDETEKAIDLYKDIATKDSNSLKSFRDVAFSYIQNKEYVNAWKVYKYLLIKGNKIDDSNLGKIITAEMLMTYQKLKEQNMISEKFQFNEFSSIDKADVRIVFEWNEDSDIAFELVNPKKQSYTYSPVNDEIETTCKDFYITDLKNGGWKVNALAANKKNETTRLKTTLYKNWEKPNQTQTSKIFYLDKKNLKYNLFDF